MKAYVVRAKMTGGSNSRESDEDYQQFKSMLGDAPGTNRQKLDAKSAAYADFADMLGLDGSSNEQEDSKKSVAKLSPKKVEIDPADYSLFDAMLERTGGTGTKPTKGGKRYSAYLKNNKREGARRGNIENDVDSQTRNFDEGLEMSAKDTHAKYSLTAEEKSQAYAVMMEEFGPGVHDMVETLSPDDDPDELEPPIQLFEPPKRPGLPHPAEAATEEYDTATSEPATIYADIREKDDSLLLETKPSRPIYDDQSTLNETAEHALLQDDMEATHISASNSFHSQQLQKESLPQPLEDRSQQDDDELASKISETKAEIQPELRPPPIRSSGDEDIGNHKAPVVEPVQEPALSTYDEDYEEIPPVPLPKPKNRLDPGPGSTMNNHLQLDSDTGRSHPSSQKRFSRNRRLEYNGPIEVLKNPKLVCKISE